MQGRRGFAVQLCTTRDAGRNRRDAERKLAPSAKRSSSMNAIVRLVMPAALAIAAIVTPAVASADQPGKHPHFLHALSDLRNARTNLEKRGGDAQMKWDE